MSHRRGCLSTFLVSLLSLGAARLIYGHLPLASGLGAAVGLAEVGPARPPARHVSFSGEVVAVLDGDTVIVLTPEHDEVRVRLAFIDAPEKAQAWGQRAKQAMSALVFRRQVVVEVQDQDRYGRQVGRIICQGQDVNLAMLRMGLAWAYRQYLPPSYAGIYLEAERDARRGRRGLWNDPAPLPPWEFRHRDRR